MNAGDESSRSVSDPDAPCPQSVMVCGIEEGTLNVRKSLI
jgi:membrane protein implicated in regulation of membrane protease activity